MIKSFFSKWFNRSSSTTSPNKIQVPKAFQGGKKSIFLNKYAGLIYFIITWHAVGYLIISFAKNTAKKEGLLLFWFL